MEQKLAKLERMLDEQKKMAERSLGERVETMLLQEEEQKDAGERALPERRDAGERTLPERRDTGERTLPERRDTGERTLPERRDANVLDDETEDGHHSNHKDNVVEPLARIVDRWVGEHEHQDCKARSREDVCLLLTQLGMFKHISLFFDRGVGGDVLVALDEEALRAIGVRHEDDLRQFATLIAMLKGRTTTRTGTGTAADMASTSTSAKLVDSTSTSAKLVDSTSTSAKLVDSTSTSAKLVDSTSTSSKLAVAGGGELETTLLLTATTTTSTTATATADSESVVPVLLSQPYTQPSPSLVAGTGGGTGTGYEEYRKKKERVDDDAEEAAVGSSFNVEVESTTTASSSSSSSSSSSGAVGGGRSNFNVEALDGPLPPAEDDRTSSEGVVGDVHNKVMMIPDQEGQDRAATTLQSKQRGKAAKAKVWRGRISA